MTDPARPATHRATMAVRVTAGGVVTLIGIGMALGGGRLIALGGSVYYLIAGVVLAASGILYARRARTGLALYGAFLLGTLGWALWEVGVDGWALWARLGAPLVLGALLLAPTVMRLPNSRGRRTRWGAAGGIVILLAVFGWWITAMPSGHDAPSMDTSAPQDWPRYGGTPGGERYSASVQITPDTIGRLRRLWTFHTGVSIPTGAAAARYSMESTPLEADGRMYVCTSDAQLIAIDAETGRESWRFRPHADLSKVPFPVCRGVSYYQVPDATGLCAHRILFATVYNRLIAFDAATGAKCPGFGVNGEVDLLASMGSMTPGPYYPTSPPMIVRGKALVGGLVWDNVSRGEPSGVVRAFDAVDGHLAWAWDMGRANAAKLLSGGETFTRGTPNVWAPINADETLGLAYLPTGNETPDYFGGGRQAVTEIYGSSLVAIDVDTGQAKWRFQTTHHDLWDYDVSSQPVLTDFPVRDKAVPAVIVPNKRGELFVLDRRSGQPLVTVAERSVPQGAVAGDRTAPTQPFAIGMPSLAEPRLTESTMWGITPLDQLWCRIRFRTLRYDGAFTPPSLQGSLQNPGTMGVISAHGISVDPQRKLLFANTGWIPYIYTMIPRALLGSNAWGASSNARTVPAAGTPYAVRSERFLSPLVIPCNAPPWGHLTAIDLTTRRTVWNVPFGDGRNSGPFGMRIRIPLPIGTPNTGGSAVTAGGVLFIGATPDAMFRAYDVRNGRLLWQDAVPGGAHASPSIFTSRSGKQTVVISAGGQGIVGSPLSDAVVAYALAER